MAFKRKTNDQERQEYDRPEGRLLIFIGPENDPKKYCLMASMSDFTGSTKLDIRRWVKLQSGKWTRTSMGINIPPEKMAIFLEKLKSFIIESQDE